MPWGRSRCANYTWEFCQMCDSSRLPHYQCGVCEPCFNVFYHANRKPDTPEKKKRRAEACARWRARHPDYQKVERKRMKANREKPDYRKAVNEKKRKFKVGSLATLCLKRQGIEVPVRIVSKAGLYEGKFRMRVYVMGPTGERVLVPTSWVKI